MNRSKPDSTHRVLSAVLTLAFAVIVGAAAFYLTRPLVPVTGPAGPAQAEASANDNPVKALPALQPAQSLSSSEVEDLVRQHSNRMAKALPALQPAQSLSSSEIEDLVRQQGYRMDHAQSTSGLVQAVRQGTESYKDVEAAKADGHGEFLGCVSGQQSGAMGVHYPNGSLVGDGILDPMHPEVLIYEVKNGKYDLVGVGFLVLVEDWHKNNAAPPVLMGQVFHYNGSPNRYGMPAFYELHVWAWKHNPNGVFADWNPNVSCEGFD